MVIETQNAMQCFAFKSDNQTMAFKEQSTIPKATFIEIGVYLNIVAQSWVDERM